MCIWVTPSWFSAQGEQCAAVSRGPNHSLAVSELGLASASAQPHGVGNTAITSPCPLLCLHTSCIGITILSSSVSRLLSFSILVPSPFHPIPSASPSHSSNVLVPTDPQPIPSASSSPSHSFSILIPVPSHPHLTHPLSLCTTAATSTHEALGNPFSPRDNILEEGWSWSRFRGIPCCGIWAGLWGCVNGALFDTRRFACGSGSSFLFDSHLTALLYESGPLSACSNRVGLFTIREHGIPRKRLRPDILKRNTPGVTS